MKLMDEVKLESSVEALEALCAPFDQHPNWAAIRQNLQALREVLTDTICPACAGFGERELQDTTRGPDGGTHLVNCPDCKGTGHGRRFFMNHGLWHDRETGQHLYTQDQYDAALKDATEGAWAALEAAGVPRDGWSTLAESVAYLAAHGAGRP